MFYEAIALGERFPKGRKAGTIEIDSHKMVFRSDLGDITWFLNDVELSFGGAGNSLIYIKNRNQPDVTFYTHNKKILKDPALLGSENALNTIKKVKTHFHTKWVVWAVVVLLILSPFIAFFAYRTAIVKKIASKVPVKYEQKAGEQLFTLLSKNYTIIKDSTLNAQFAEIVKPLVKVVEDPEFKLSFYIISDTSVNAFALPGGKVVVNSGLILKSDNWTEIQGVLAHEIAHVTLRHHVRGVINNRGLFFVLSTFLGGYSGLIDVIANYGSTLESLMYSRKFEYEADASGFDYMVKANANPNGMTTFFQKLLDVHKEEPSSGFMKMLSTHPGTEDRIKNLKEMESKLPNSEYMTYNTQLKDFQRNLKSKLKP